MTGIEHNPPHGHSSPKLAQRRVLRGSLGGLLAWNSLTFVAVRAAAGAAEKANARHHVENPVGFTVLLLSLVLIHALLAPLVSTLAALASARQPGLRAGRALGRGYLFQLVLLLVFPSLLLNHAWVAGAALLAHAAALTYVTHTALKTMKT